MEPNAAIKINLRQIQETLIKYRWLWITPTVAMTLLALIFSVAMPRKWSAKQSFLVREEVGNNLRGLGKFDNNEAMKTAQETIQELARHRVSVESTLKLLGPPKGYANPAQWPTSEDITETQKIISIFAPNGTEFGKTEVIYISTTAETKERAVQLTKGIGDELEKRLGDFRHQKLESIVTEVEKRASVVESELDAATERLQTFEGEIGSDLSELRTLSESGGGDGNLRNQQIAIRNDLRQANTLRESLLQLKEMIDTAHKDPTNFLATPSRLLDAQLGLKKAKEALVEMQAQSAKLAGMMSSDHPRVKEARLAENEMRENLHRELKESSRGVESDLKANAAQISSLDRQLAKVNDRLDQLAGSRAQYVNLVAEVKRCRETLEKTQRELSDSRAALSGARFASLISRLDSATAGDRPLGPGKSVIILSGFASGLATGLGLVFLFAPMGSTGRRLSDYLPFNRRASDRTNSRRANDPRTIAATTAIPGGRRNSDPPPAPALTSTPAVGRRAADQTPPMDPNVSERERRRNPNGRRSRDVDAQSLPNLTPPPAVPLAPLESTTPASTNTTSP